MHHTTTTADGTTLTYQVTGPDHAPPLLLLPGQANSHHWWDGLRESYSRTHRSITFDYRGTGASRSAPTSERWSTELFAADAVAVLDAVEVTSADVFGTSMGGRVAQMLAIEHPHRVTRLVLACTSPGGPLARERDQSVRRSLAQADPSARRQALLELMYTPAWAAAHANRSHLLGDPSMTADARRRHLETSARHDASDRLGAVSAPTLVLHGVDDRMVPAANAQLLADAVPDAVLHLTLDGRHGFFEEFADDIVPRVLDFLA